MSQLNFKNGNIESEKKSINNRYMQRDTPSFQRKKWNLLFSLLSLELMSTFLRSSVFLSFVPFPSFSITKKMNKFLIGFIL